MAIQHNEYSGMKVLVMGLGLNGGGLPSALYLAGKGAELCITDLRDEKTLAPSLEILEADLSGGASRIRYVLGRHEIADFEKADMVVKNPGVRPDSPYLKAARRIETDISLFLTASPGRLTAVTGSKGKSSISSALYHVLNNWHLSSQSDPGKEKAKAFLGGNITLSPLSFLDKLKEGDDVVLELSSWQLGDLKGRVKGKNREALLKPRTAVIGAIMPDHLDRYPSMDAYVDDKRIICQGQDESDATIAGNDSWGQSFCSQSRGRALVYSDAPLPSGLIGGWMDEDSGCGLVRLWDGIKQGKTNEIVEAVPRELLIPGRHQKKNLLAAALALLDLGLPHDFIRESFKKFGGIEHRLEFFHEARGIRFYNDSAATIPEAAAAAITAFDNPPVLVCGGTDKNLDFSPLVKSATCAKAIILLAGSGSDKLMPLLNAAGNAYFGPWDSLDKALIIALEQADPNDAVVLSPGCTSFGMFINEFDRGNKWKETVLRLVPQF